jgi:fructose-1,6-bisphosphatase
VITGILIDALQGRPLSSFSVPVRISWAKKRETKREEDKAYSLMGIFGIHMSPIYSEGEAKAFERLYSEIVKRESHQEKLLQVFQDEN